MTKVTFKLLLMSENIKPTRQNKKWEEIGSLQKKGPKVGENSETLAEYSIYLHTRKKTGLLFTWTGQCPNNMTITEFQN